MGILIYSKTREEHLVIVWIKLDGARDTATNSMPRRPKVSSISPPLACSATALPWTLARFLQLRPYLLDKPFGLHTDNASLQ